MLRKVCGDAARLHLWSLAAASKEIIAGDRSMSGLEALGFLSWWWTYIQKLSRLVDVSVDTV